MMTLAAIFAVVTILEQQRADAVALVHAVEAATAQVHDFRAAVTVDRVDSLTDESERRIGRVLLESVGASANDPSGASAAPANTRRLALILDTYLGADGRADESRRHFIYDGGWLAEIDLDRRQFVNRQIVAPGETFDPLRVGEGPLPLPIGQRADDVLARFDVMTVTVPSSGLLRSLTGVRGVRLVPKSGSGEAQETRSVDLFYDEESFLPRGVIQRRVNGDRVEVQLRDPRMNTGLSEEERGLLTIRTPDPRDGWAVDVRPWRRGGEPMDKE